MQSFSPLLLLQPSSIFTNITWLCALYLEHNVWLDSNLLGECHYLFLWQIEAQSVNYLLKLFHIRGPERGLIFCLPTAQPAIFHSHTQKNCSPAYHPRQITHFKWSYRQLHHSWLVYSGRGKQTNKPTQTKINLKEHFFFFCYWILWVIEQRQK